MAIRALLSADDAYVNSDLITQLYGDADRFHNGFGVGFNDAVGNGNNNTLGNSVYNSESDASYDTHGHRDGERNVNRLPHCHVVADYHRNSYGTIDRNDICDENGEQHCVHNNDFNPGRHADIVGITDCDDYGNDQRDINRDDWTR